MNTKLWFIVPCYNEEEVVEDTAKRLKDKYMRLLEKGMISSESRIIFIDDGSKDRTWEIIKALHEENAIFIGVKLAHNRGHQNALMAGMMYAKDRCDCIISLDADLQDDIEVVDEFIDKYKSGTHIVYGVRHNRGKDSMFKRGTAGLFYKIMNALGAETIQNHADYRLMSNKALEALEGYKEVNLFLRGVVPLIGLKTETVYYERKERMAGKTKYPLKRMISFALDGITSFSVKPLRIISLLGMLCSILSVGGLIYALSSYIFGYTVPGWTAIVCSIWLLGGIQLLCLGVVGEYIGKIFSEVKQRPRFFVEDILE